MRRDWSGSRIGPRVEILEDRLVLSWRSVPPVRIKVPHHASIVALDIQSDAQGMAAIAGKEVDYYQLKAPVSGYYRFSAQGLLGTPNTVLAVFNRKGGRLGYNDNAGPGHSDSELLMNLVAGRKYFFGISKVRGTPKGDYFWSVDGPLPGPADDPLEENDSPARATNLGTLTGLRTESGLVMADGADWFRFLMNGPGTAADFVRIRFADAQGDLDMVVYNLGLAEIGRSTGTGDLEQVSLNGQRPGIYYVKVIGYQGARNPAYTLEIAPGNRPRLDGDDDFEDNDSFPEACNLGTLDKLTTYADLVLGDNADWFSFTMPGLGTAADLVRIDFPNAQNDLALELYNSSGKLLARSDASGDREEISLAGHPAGTYFLAIAGSGPNRAPYTLAIDPGVATPAAAFNIQLSFNGLTASQRAIFNQAAERWAEIITTDLPDAVYLGQIVDDVFIEAYAFSIDGPNGILGQAAPTDFRVDGSLPYHGFMVFDSADLAVLEANGSLRDVILHEMGHVLGIGTIWDKRGLIAGQGTVTPRFTGAQATAEYNAIFGLSAAAVPVEGQAGPGSDDSHWRESVFGNELMTPFLSGATRPLSRVTVASLADLGYTVNLDAADPYAPPGSVLAPLAGGGAGAGIAPLKKAARAGNPRLLLRV